MGGRRTKKLGSLLLTLSAIAAAGYLSYSLNLKYNMRELHDKAERRLAVFSATLFAPTDKYSYLPELVSTHPIVVDALQHKDDVRLVQRANVFLERASTGAKAAAIYILNDKGLAIAASNWQQPQSFIGKNYAFRPYFQDALREGSGKFYGMGMTSMMPGYYLSHVIRNDSRTLGVAVIKIDLSNLDAGWTAGEGYDEFIVADENGVVFLSSRSEWKYRPMNPLSPTAKAELNRTHQYDAVLKEPLSITTLKELQPGERLTGILPKGGEREEARYLLKSAPLAGSDWTVYVLIPSAEADARAMRAGIAGAGVVAFFTLAVLYVQQARRRIRDRERSRQELELTHKALEQQHSALQNLTEELRISSITDPLTGAYNRRFFFEAVGKLASSANRHRSALSIVTIDVDHFKRINDMYGHPAGDTVLRTLTGICKETLREADIFARFGGEEFIMALPNSNSTAAYAAAERLRLKVMEQEIEIKGETLRITLSCGVSQYRLNEPGIDETLRRADVALYEAKNSGRNRVVLC